MIVHKDGEMDNEQIDEGRKMEKEGSGSKVGTPPFTIPKNHFPRRVTRPRSRPDDYAVAPLSRA